MPPGGFGRYSALVIAVDPYENLPALGNAVRDARAAGALLRDDYGYEVIEFENWAAWRSAMSSYRFRPQGRG